MLVTGAPLDFLSSEDREWPLGKALAEVLNRPEEPLPGSAVAHSNVVISP